MLPKQLVNWWVIRLRCWLDQFAPEPESYLPVGLPPPGVPFPDYVPCPFCGEPEIEVWCYERMARCHNCGRAFAHAVDPQCGRYCARAS